ncbi:MAG: RnfABCDGE type electron transport complex subunit D [Oscillospiraceae bacterium]|jgi:electron transport complex protein RnfD|nr:RnfABCDGE type electron transport complex subunit D [Oscillospiraceae bacterium]
MKLLTVSPAPHIHGKATTSGIMRDVLIALAPAAVASAVIFGLRALLVIAVCVASSVVFEWGYEKLTKRDNTVRDMSACVTGVLLAYNLPVTIPLWQAVVGSAVAIILVKQLFGGIGRNFANPAITARIFMALAFAGTMSNFTYDAVTSATPLVYLQNGAFSFSYSVRDLFLGTHAGVLGETCAVALIIGFVYLLIRRVISWETSVVYVVVVFALSAAFGWDPVRSILSGGLMLGAIFMATDYVTAPMTFWGRVIFGAGCGVLTVIIRRYGSYPEGVSFSILLMNILTPYINKLTMSRPFGGART